MATTTEEKTLLMRIDLTPKVTDDVGLLIRALKCLLQLKSGLDSEIKHIYDISEEIVDLLFPSHLTEIAAGLLHMAYSPAMSSRQVRNISGFGPTRCRQSKCLKLLRLWIYSV